MGKNPPWTPAMILTYFSYINSNFRLVLYQFLCYWKELDILRYAEWKKKRNVSICYESVKVEL